MYSISYLKWCDLLFFAYREFLYCLDRSSLAADPVFFVLSKLHVWGCLRMIMFKTAESYAGTSYKARYYHTVLKSASFHDNSIKFQTSICVRPPQFPDRHTFSSIQRKFWKATHKLNNMNLVVVWVFNQVHTLLCFSICCFCHETSQLKMAHRESAKAPNEE